MATTLVSTGITFPDATTQTTAAASAFATGVKMVFYQASAPTGWTKDTTHNNKALRVVSGTGGGSGGSWDLSSGATSSSAGAHTHTGASHTHSTPSHSHSHTLSAGSHTLTFAEMPNHSHGIGAQYSAQPITGVNRGFQSSSSTTTGWGTTSGTRAISTEGGGGSHAHSLSGSITSGGSGTSGSGGTGSTSSAGAHAHTISAPKYIDVIVCSKQ